MSEATVDTRQTGGRIDYTLTGTRDAVEEAIRRIKAAYHPLGYGTYFAALPPADENGIVSVRGYRYSSCD